MANISWCLTGVEKHKCIFSVLNNFLNIFQRWHSFSGWVSHDSTDRVWEEFRWFPTNWAHHWVQVSFWRILTKNSRWDKQGWLSVFSQTWESKDNISVFPSLGKKRQELYFFLSWRGASFTCSSSVYKVVDVVVHICKSVEETYYPVTVV